MSRPSDAQSDDKALFQGGLRSYTRAAAAKSLPVMVDRGVDVIAPMLETELPKSPLKDKLDSVQIRAYARPYLEKLFATALDLQIESVGPYLDGLEESLLRISDLVKASSGLQGGAGQDVLRAAVVLTHAYLEDFLRTIAATILPTCDEKCLNDIPLAGLSPSGRAEKFFLGKLVRHNGKTVDELLRQSIAEYLDRLSFNSTDDISHLLATLGFGISEHSESFPRYRK
jgi:hypothetical protein